MKPSRAVLERATLVRNAIAHKSRYSLLRFERDVIRDTPLTRREGSPAGFLRGTMAAVPVQTRYEAYVVVSRLLWKFEGRPSGVLVDGSP